MKDFINQNKIYLLVAIVFVVILTLSWLTYNSSRIITERSVKNYQQSIVTEASKIVDLWLQQHLRIIQATADAVQQIQIGNNPQTLRLLKTAMKAGNFSDVYIGLQDGTMIDGADWIPPKGYDPRLRPWYRTAMKEGKISFTTPYVDMTTHKIVIAIVMPLTVDNKFNGVISSDIVLDTLKKNVMNVKIGNSGHTFVIDSQGTVLIHPDEAMVMSRKIQQSDPSLEKVLDYLDQTGTGSYFYRFEGQEKILSFRRLSNADWFLCTTVLKEEAYTLAKNTAMLFAMDVVFKILGIVVGLLFLAIGGSVLILLISKKRFEKVLHQKEKLLFGIDRDLKGEINRRKEIETRYQTLFNVTMNAIMLSRDFTFIECNEKAETLFGLNQEQLIGKSMLDLWRKIQQDGLESQTKINKIKLDLEKGEEIIFEWTFKKAHGSEFPAEVGVISLKLDSEIVTLFSIWDISKRADAEQELRQVQKMAAMGEMLSAIAHQWRQPLNALSTYIASLTAAFYNQLITKEFIHKLVKESDTQIQFMSRTINDFKEYFRPSKTKQAFEVHDAVNNAVKLIMPQLKQNAILFEFKDLPEFEEVWVFGYKNEFIHVLVNIISNANDAINERWKKDKSGKNNRRIVLSISKTETALQMEICDTGFGIPDSLLPKIFTPYFTTKGTAIGTGIGLYMAKMIVEKEMHGQIIAENHLSGARFQIELPLSELKGRKHA